MSEGTSIKGQIEEEGAWGVTSRDDKLTVEEGDNVSIFRAEETRGEGEERGNQREGIMNDHQGREARWRKCNGKSWRK